MSLLGAGILGFIAVNVAMLLAGWGVWYERKFAGRMQSRPGPTEVGPIGLLQPIADILKLMQKEDTVPRDADAGLFHLAPPLTVLVTLAVMAVTPFGPGLVVADLEVGLLFALAIGSVIVLPVWMAGWASNNKYALLGAMRSAAQGVAYEVPLLLAAAVPVIYAGSFRISDIVEAQAGYHWYVGWPPGPGLVAFCLFFLCSLAEANRIPFDIPEAESELVAGVSIEYSGMKFGLFYVAEYLHTIIASLLAALLFLGGWEGPGSDQAPWLGTVWLLAKTLGLFGFIFWARWTFMRYRSDQLMRLCWVVFVPTGLALVASSAVLVWLGVV